MKLIVKVFLAFAIASAAFARTEGAVPVNPLIQQRADPLVLRHSDGYYYLTATVPEYDRIVLRRSKRIAGLADATEHVIWRRRAQGEMAVTSGHRRFISSKAEVERGWHAQPWDTGEGWADGRQAQRLSPTRNRVTDSCTN